MRTGRFAYLLALVVRFLLSLKWDLETIAPSPSPLPAALPELELGEVVVVVVFE